MPNSPQEWSLTLQGIIKPSAERKRLATVLGLSDMTLLRWASGESNPQRPHLIRLVHALQPQHRDEILGQLEKVYPEIHSWLKSNANESITSEFFAQVMHVRTTTTEHLRFWRISDMVLKQALLQLDPNISGLSVKLIRCMPPRGGKVRSIRECAGKGTPPWNNDLEHDVLFLGMESMSGYTTESRRFVNDGNLHKGKMIPAYPGEYEVSAIAQPIQFKGHIAGCLLAASVQEDYFTQQRVLLMENFANLISLAFDNKDFYQPALVELRFMPQPRIQKPFIATFRDRVTRRVHEAAHKGLRVNNAAVELAVWQEIEGELLALPDDGGDPYQ